MSFITKPLLTTWLNAYLPPVIWALSIFLLSSQSALPSFETGLADFIFKKCAHMFVYAVLYWLLARGVHLTISAKYPTARLYAPLVLCLLYALSDEFHQSLVIGRYATARDVGYDLLGAGIAFLRKYQYI